MTSEMTILALAISLGALVVSLATLIFKGKVQEADIELTARIIAMQANKEQMRLLEQQYQTMNASVRAALDLAGALVAALAPLTRLAADDQLAQFIADVQTPGAPDEKRDTDNKRSEF
jgi:hypothetical protein